ncbi:ATP-binding protein [Escherichia coli]|nr:ATP-binding protein [Escherichia coli]
MDLATLETVFLAIGTPSKVNSESTKDLNRKILGNKGIGRLAMMRLGDIANVTSWVEQGSAHEIEFDWRMFDDPEKIITDIEFEIKPTTCPRPTPSGTVIKITALKSSWTEEKVREKLVGDFFRRLQNPFVMSLDEGSSDNTKKIKRIEL